MSPHLPDLPALLPSWQLHLRSANKSEGTIRSYSAGVTAFLRWCERTGTTPELSRRTVEAFTADLLADGAEPTTAKGRQMGLKRFAAWLASEGEIDTDELRGMTPPKVDVKVTDTLTDEEVRRLIATCKGKSFTDKRDEAIIRLMVETACRAGELLAMTPSDIDVHRGVVLIRRGKGGVGRWAPFSPQTAAAVDKYLRMRRTQHPADTGPLWIGAQNKGFGYFGLRRTLTNRAELAGIKRFHAHLLRHTGATRWLRAGGSEGGLMAVAGWKDRSMLDRYVSASKSERAIDESRGLNLGEL
jgi:site-specific recombinase XerD